MAKRAPSDPRSLQKCRTERDSVARERALPQRARSLFRKRDWTDVQALSLPPPAVRRWSSVHGYSFRRLHAITRELGPSALLVIGVLIAAYAGENVPRVMLADAKRAWGLARSLVDGRS